MSGSGPVLDHPALAGFSEILPLSGFSGAQVFLVRSPGGNPFVRKASREIGVNETLRRQARRQTWLGGVVGDAATVPAVLDEGEAEGLYYFDMSFVPSRDAVSFLSTAPFGELRRFADRVTDLMTTLSTTASDDQEQRTPTCEAILRKIDEITLKTEGVFAEALDPLRRATLQLDTLVAGSGIRTTASHGDLTFENMLVDKNGHLWLIDPIESPFDHYWVDWSKLFQECEGGWHRHRGRSIASGVTWWLRNHWIDAAEKLSRDYPSRHYLLLSLIFARILPYTRSDADRAMVVDRVRRYGLAALHDTKEPK